MANDKKRQNRISTQREIGRYNFSANPQSTFTSRKGQSKNNTSKANEKYSQDFGKQSDWYYDPNNWQESTVYDHSDLESIDYDRPRITDLIKLPQRPPLLSTAPLIVSPISRPTFPDWNDPDFESKFKIWQSQMQDYLRRQSINEEIDKRLSQQQKEENDNNWLKFLLQEAPIYAGPDLTLSPTNAFSYSDNVATALDQNYTYFGEDGHWHSYFGNDDRNLTEEQRAAGIQRGDDINKAAIELGLTEAGVISLGAGLATAPAATIGELLGLTALEKGAEAVTPHIAPYAARYAGPAIATVMGISATPTANALPAHFKRDLFPGVYQDSDLVKYLEGLSDVDWHELTDEQLLEIAQLHPNFAQRERPGGGVEYYIREEKEPGFHWWWHVPYETLVPGAIYQFGTPFRDYRKIGASQEVSAPLLESYSNNKNKGYIIRNKNIIGENLTWNKELKLWQGYDKNGKLIYQDAIGNIYDPQDFQEVYSNEQSIYDPQDFQEVYSNEQREKVGYTYKDESWRGKEKYVPEDRRVKIDKNYYYRAPEDVVLEGKTPGKYDNVVTEKVKLRALKHPKIAGLGTNALTKLFVGYSIGRPLLTGTAEYMLNSNNTEKKLIEFSKKALDIYNGVIQPPAPLVDRGGSQINLDSTGYRKISDPDSVNEIIELGEELDQEDIDLN